MGKIWCWVAEPILFVTVGSTLDFSTLSSGTVPKSIIIVVAGVTVRVVCTYVAMSDRSYNWKEKLFYAIAWTPKATVQAALSGARRAAAARALCPPPAPPSRAACERAGGAWRDPN
jgi:Kef-type K+ transport system membrane component KefB